MLRRGCRGAGCACTVPGVLEDCALSRMVCVNTEPRAEEARSTPQRIAATCPAQACIAIERTLLNVLRGCGRGSWPRAPGLLPACSHRHLQALYPAANWFTH